jgi:hypothetical protein
VIELRRAVVVLFAVVGMAVVAPAAAVGPSRVGCDWVPELLSLPANTVDGQVTGGGGAWLAGAAYDPDEGLLWRDGRLVVHGSAFDLDTRFEAVNPSGVAIGTVTGGDGRLHAIRYSGRFEYLPETAGRSLALDVNARGEVVGYDGVALVVWSAGGTARVLAMPPGAGPFGRPAIDEDGTVVARTGILDGAVMRWQTYAWTPSGERVPVAVGDVRDVRGGWAVGAFGEPGQVAAGWGVEDGRVRVYAGGVSAVAVNRTGVVVGAEANGDPLLWWGSTPVSLAAPLGFSPGSVTAVNDHDAGGFVSPLDDEGTVPLRWSCR